MGRVLTVRVQVSTFREDDVRRAWPRLWHLAFEAHQPAFPCPVRGVLELVQALDDLHRFVRLEAEAAAALEAGLPAVTAARRALEDALGRWDVRAALAATDALEDALDHLERQMPRVL